MARIIIKTNDGRHTVLDEPTGSLDEENAVEMLERLEAAIHAADRRLAPRRELPPRRPAHA